MRFIQLYLVVYFLLLCGAGLSLWQAGVLARFPFPLVLLTGVCAVALGAALLVTSRRPSIRG